WALSPNASQVVYALAEGDRRASRLAVRRLDSTEPHLFLDVSPIHILDWTRDGKALLYRLREGVEDPFPTVWIHDLASDERRLFYSAKPDNVFDVSIAPDQKRIAAVRGKLRTDAVMLTKIESQ